MMRFEQSWAKSLNTILRKQYRAAAKEVRSGRPSRLEWAIDKYAPEMEQMFIGYYQRIASTFSSRAIAEVGKAFSPVEETKGPVADLFWSRMRRWMRKGSVDKVSQINATTKKKVRKIISDGMQNQEYDETLGQTVPAPLTVTQIASKISIAGNMEKWRAVMIARTETHTTAVMSTQGAIESVGAEVGVTWNKYWSNATDDRTRDSHLQAGIDYGPSGAIPMKAKYKIAFPGTKKLPGGFDLMDHPGDPTAHAANVVRCRCIELYLPAEQGQPQAVSIAE